MTNGLIRYSGTLGNLCWYLVLAVFSKSSWKSQYR